MAPMAVAPVATIAAPVALPAAAGTTTTAPAVHPKKSKTGSKRNASRKAAEAATGTTPWLPTQSGQPPADISLSSEMVAFSNFIRLSPTERHSRLTCIKRMEAASRAEFGMQVVVMPYGSFVSQTMVSSSALDLSIQGVPFVAKANMDSFLKRAGADMVTCVEDPNRLAGFCQAKAWEGFLVNITFHALGQPNPAVASNHVTSRWLAQYPQSVHTHAVLRQLLEQTGNMDVTKGGLSSYALLTMVISVCRAHPTISSAALLVEFCRMFGTVFNYATQAVSTACGCVVRPCVSQPQGTTDSADDLLYIEDPTDSTNNLAAGCSRVFAIKAQFRHCYKTLQRWNMSVVNKTNPQASNATPAKSYKGRTPLSGIIGYQLLWARAELLKKNGAVQQQPVARVAPAPRTCVPVAAAMPLQPMNNRSIVSLAGDNSDSGSENATEVPTECGSSNGLTSHSSNTHHTDLFHILRTIGSSDSLASLEDDADDAELLRESMEHDF